MNAAPRITRFLLLPAWVLGLAAVAWLLATLDTSSLATPGWTTDAWSTWFSQASASVMLFTLLRLLALTATVYLAATLVLSVLAELTRVRVLQRLSSACSLPIVQRMVRNSVGLATAASLALPAVANAATPADWPVLHHVDPNPATTPATNTTGATSRPVLPTTTTTVVPPTTTTGIAGPGPAVMETRPAPIREHTVRSGESLWSIADAELQNASTHPATEREIQAYVKRLVDANTTVLIDPANPDLIFSGQVFRLPLP